jgi:fructose-1-phosphate kinase PfkB-like protein
LDLVLSEPRYGLPGKAFYGQSSLFAGGSGVNVARGLRALGMEADLFLVLGGRNRGTVGELLAVEGLPYDAVAGRGETRVAVIEYRRGAKRMAVAPSPELDAETVEEFTARCRPAVAGARLVFFGGSFPARSEAQAPLLKLLRGVRERLVIDTRGPAERALLAAGPRCAKVDAAVRGSGAARAKALAAHLAGTTLACAEGPRRVFAAFDGAVHGYPQFGSPRRRHYGRGDAFMAGLLCGMLRGLDADRCMRLALAAATADATDRQGLGGIDVGRLYEASADLVPRPGSFPRLEGSAAR